VDLLIILYELLIANRFLAKGSVNSKPGHQDLLIILYELLIANRFSEKGSVKAANERMKGVNKEKGIGRIEVKRLTRLL